jgi:hypothetical protein
MAPLRHVVLAIPEFAGLLGYCREVCFKVKKVPNGKKDLMTDKSKTQNQSQKTVSAIKRFTCANVSFFSTGGRWVTANAYQVLLC